MSLRVKRFWMLGVVMVSLRSLLEIKLKNTERKALEEIKRVLKKDGNLFISTPANNFSNFFDPAWYFGHRHYNK